MVGICDLKGKLPSRLQRGQDEGLLFGAALEPTQYLGEGQGDWWAGQVGGTGGGTGVGTGGETGGRTGGWDRCAGVGEVTHLCGICTGYVRTYTGSTLCCCHHMHCPSPSPPPCIACQTQESISPLGRVWGCAPPHSSHLLVCTAGWDQTLPWMS